MNLHENSLAAYRAGQLDIFDQRERLVLSAYEKLGSATDREVRDYLGFTDGNAVKPRISGLIDAGVCEEVGTRVDAVTKRQVRVVRIVPQVVREPQQLELAVA